MASVDLKRISMHGLAGAGYVSLPAVNERGRLRRRKSRRFGRSWSKRFVRRDWPENANEIVIGRERLRLLDDGAAFDAQPQARSEFRASECGRTINRNLRFGRYAIIRFLLPICGGDVPGRDTGDGMPGSFPISATEVFCGCRKSRTQTSIAMTNSIPASVRRG